MTVTDMSESLPWWARGAAPQAQGPTPPQGVNPQAWLEYLSNMFVGSAQAGEAPPNNGGPSPDDRAAAQAAIAAQGGQGGPPPADDRIPPTLPPAAPPAASILPQARGTAVPPDPSQGPILPQARGVAVPPGPMAAGNSILPEGAAQGAVPMGPPIPPGGVPQGRDITVNPRAAVPGPMAPQGRFIGIDAPNANPQNSARPGPQGTALNLAGLFGGGQPAAPAAAAPVPGPMARGARPDLAQRVPLAQAPMPPIMPEEVAAARKKGNQSVARARILAPDYYG